MKKKIAANVNVVAALVLGLFLVLPVAFKQKEERKSTTVIVSPPAIPAQLSFAGEPAPLDRWDIRERFDRELLINYYNTGTVLFLLKKAARYFPIISEELKAAGVPDDFKYLCIAESNMVSDARSRSNAVGYWQFINGTAPGYGLTVSSEVDDRMDIIRSTKAACQYLKRAHAKFGNWTAAAASYNCGQGGYNSQATSQGTTNYYDLVLPDETKRYIFRILTFKHLIENAAELGFEIKDADTYGPIAFRTITVSATIPNLVAFARANGTTYYMLRQMNPWLRGRSLMVTGGKSYTLKLPATE